nr:glycosyl hydrolase family 65 protein [Actinoplanes consettensis]
MCFRLRWRDSVLRVTVTPVDVTYEVTGDPITFRHYGKEVTSPPIRPSPSGSNPSRTVRHRRHLVRRSGALTPERAADLLIPGGSYPRQGW